jgi:signal transduction histidine kinase
MVNDILDVEKFTSGVMQFDIKPVEIGPFLKRALDLNRMFAEQFKVHFELRGPIPPAVVMADRERLMQVVTNLLSNAAKFSPPGAVVIIAAHIRDSSMIRISITDHGPGVPSQFRDRIFQRFAQADASNTRKQGGTGLGLSICKLIVEKLNGGIGYESEPGQGATFYIELPLGKDAPGESPVEPEPAH